MRKHLTGRWCTKWQRRCVCVMVEWAITDNDKVSIGIVEWKPAKPEDLVYLTDFNESRGVADPP